MDRAISDELRSTGAFDVMSLDTDESEHSIEMQLPYVRYNYYHYLCNI